MNHHHFKIAVKLSTIGWFMSYLISVRLVGMFAFYLSKDLVFDGSLQSIVLDELGLAIALLSVNSDIQHLIEH